MELFFLGKSYTASTSSVESTESQETITFLGRRSKVKQYHVAQRQQPGEQLVFLGRRYTR